VTLQNLRNLVARFLRSHHMSRHFRSLLLVGHVALAQWVKARYAGRDGWS
jgi:hypothetical protein